MATKEKFERTKPHLNIGTIGHVFAEDIDLLIDAVAEVVKEMGLVAP